MSCIYLLKCSFVNLTCRKNKKNAIFAIIKNEIIKTYHL